MYRIALLFVLIVLVTAACGGRASLSPTPFPTPTLTTTPAAQGPVTLTVTELAGAPGLFVDAVVQVTGRFRKQPILACTSDPHPSPAAWGLAEEGLEVLAGGYDQQVRSLLPTDLLVTAEGRWRRWEGLVGCGKQAVPKEVWYLDVTRILSPSPLTQVTLTPEGVADAGTEIAEVPPGEEEEPTVELFPTDEELFPELPPEETPEFPEPTEFPEEPDDPFATLAVPTSIVTPSPEGFPTADLLTPTPEGTVTPQATGTPTVTGTPPTVQPTATGSVTGDIVGKGDLFDLEETIWITTLDANRIDSWSSEFSGEEGFRLYAIAPPPADLILSFIKDGQPIIDRRNAVPAGSPEVIDATALAGEGVYEIHVATQGGGATQYAILANFDSDFPVLFNGFITPGSPRNDLQLPLDASHFWFFTAEAGDTITISATPDAAADLYFELFGPDGEPLEAMDEGFEGEAEVLEVELTEPGMYAIMLFDLAGVPMTYDLSLTLE